MNSLHEIFSTQLANALGWSLLHSLWQGLLITGILFLALNFLRNANANLRYWMSVGALSAILLSFAVTFSLLYDHSTTVKTTINENVQLIQSLPLMIDATPLKEASFFDKMLNLIPQYWAWILPFWMVGVFIGLIRMSGAYLLLRKRIHQAVPEDSIYLEKVKELAAELHIHRMIKVLKVGFVKSPAVFGHLKPVILLPIGLVNHLSMEQVEMILLHELAHIKRNDFLINVIQSAAEVILFFNPAVWWISNEIRQERENCCDDLILNRGYAPVNYIKTLANVNQFSQSQWTLAPGLLGNRKNGLLKRMQRMIGQHQSSYNLQGFKLPAILLILVLSLALVSWKSQFKASNIEKIPSLTSDVRASFSSLLEPDQDLIKPLVQIVDTTGNDENRTESEIIRAQEEKIKALEAQVQRLKEVDSRSDDRNRKESEEEFRASQNQIERAMEELKRSMYDRQHIQRQVQEIKMNTQKFMDELKLEAKNWQKMSEKEKQNLQEELQRHELALNEKMHHLQLREMENMMNLESMREQLQVLPQQLELQLDQHRKMIESLDLDLSALGDFDFDMDFDHIFDDTDFSFNFNMDGFKESMEGFSKSMEGFKETMQKFHEKMEAMKSEMLRELKKDGLIDKSSDRIKIREEDDILVINGKKLTKAQDKKYKAILDKYFEDDGFEIDDHYNLDFNLKDND